MLLIVPHQDDEMLVGGSALYQFAQDKAWDTFVLYTTEGAAIHEDPETRMREAICALKVLGIPKKHIIFLGYGNGWQGRYHIYNAPEGEKLVSLKGRTETFALPEHEEHCFGRTGVHHAFTRENYKNDLMCAILDIMPDVILAVDMDDHEEHMATSLFLDECLNDIIKTKKGYCPLVLKKFAYDGLWKGEDDYFHVPRIETLNGKKDKTRNPSFIWKERIRFAVPQECDTYFLHNNILNKAVKKHISQDGWLCAVRLINSDIVYWCRRTDNLLLFADISVSSGEGRFVNDFKRVDTSDVRNKDTVWGNCSWFPQSGDDEKQIVISWKDKVCITELDIYESPEADAGEILEMHIEFDDGYEFDTGELKHGGEANAFILPEEHRVGMVKARIIRFRGKPGISEVEAYSDILDIDKFDLPIKAMTAFPVRTENLLFRRLANFLDKKIFHIKFRFFLMRKKGRL